ncbi:LuxR family transcriptional regulator [Streptomyces capparidis]
MPDDLAPDTPAQELTGRDELLRRAEDALREHRSLTLTGPAGAGKTALLRALAARASARGHRVASAAPHPADRALPGAAAAALLAGLPERALDRLPPPQRTAVAVLRREEPGGAAGADVIALRLAVADVLRALAADRPLLLVVDDAQWLDDLSADLLRAALAAVPGGAARALLAARPPVPDPQAGPLLPVPPLTADDVADLLLRHGLPVRLTGRVHLAGGGNPALTLALGRALAEGSGDRAYAADLPLPEPARRTARELLAALPDPVRRTLLYAALAGRPTAELLRRVAGPRAEADCALAEEAGVVAVEPDGTVCFTAGLLAATLTADAGYRARTSAHAALAAAVTDPVQAVRHRALASGACTEELAAELAAAAAARRRAADRVLAAELGRLAADRTPADRARARLARLVAAAEDAGLAGRADLARRAAEEILARDTSPADRVRAHLAVIDAAGQALDDLDDTYAHALHDAAGDPGLLAAVHLRLAARRSLRDGDLAGSRDAAATAARLAALVGDPATEAMAYTVQARRARALGSPDAGRLLERARVLPATDRPPLIRDSPAFEAARHALYDDRLAEARALTLPLLPAAERAGSAEDVIAALRLLAEIEARAGRCATALTHARRAVELTARAGLSLGPAWYTAALAETAGGSFTRAAACARRGLRASREEGDRLFLTRCHHALGVALLATGDTAAAVAELDRVRELETGRGVVDPSMLRWPGELAEALVAADRPEEAALLIGRVRPVAARLGRDGVLAGLDRAWAGVVAAEGDAGAATALLDTAAERFCGLGLPVERGRALLALARVERRRRRRAAARRALRAAVEVFAAASAEPWRRLAEATPPGPDGGLGPASAPAPPREGSGWDALTEAERQLALLVAEGATNQEAAGRLFVSVKTVEARLTRIYRKLGVRSRARLAAEVRDRDPLRRGRPWPP